MAIRCGAALLFCCCALLLGSTAAVPLIRNATIGPALSSNAVIILASTLAGAPGTTIGSCDCPTGPWWEVQVANDNGYDVELATDLVWLSKSVADFATYRALVLGDGSTHSATDGTGYRTADLSRQTWAAAATGNVILAGADPSKHAERYADTVSTAIGARNFISAAIAYAASGQNASGQNATGAYICLSQYFYFTPQNTLVSLLEPFTTPGKSFLANPTPLQGPACDNVTLGVVSPELQPLSAAELSGWGCSIHEYFNTSALPSGWDAMAYSTLAGAPYMLVRGTANVIISCPPGSYLDSTQTPPACVVCPPGFSSPGGTGGIEICYDPAPPPPPVFVSPPPAPACPVCPVCPSPSPTPSPDITPVPSPSPSPAPAVLPACTPGNAAASAAGGAASAATAAPLCDPSI